MRIVSVRRVKGFRYWTPWKFSTTSLPLVPSPSTALPSEISSRVATLMASRPGDRLKTFAIPVATLRRVVASAISVSSWNCS